MAQNQKPSLLDLQDTLEGAGFVPGTRAPAIEAQRAYEHRSHSPAAQIADRGLNYVLEQPNGNVIAASVVEMDGRAKILAVTVGDTRDGKFPEPFELTSQKLHELTAGPGSPPSVPSVALQLPNVKFARASAAPQRLNHT